MGDKRGTKALEAWCKRVTDGYTGVNVVNMTTSWRDGLAFCAIIHHFRPDLIDFDSLKKNDIYRNNELAFRTAEHDLGIPALLDPEDMVEYEVPDRLSILTYLSQFYRTFSSSQQGSSPSRALAKRPASSEERDIISSASESPPSKVTVRRGHREPCTKCGMPVFIAERLLVGGHLLYHRTCFRCARCQHQLSLANFYETEGGEYCCETCPDEVLDTDKKLQDQSQNDQTNLDMIGHAGPEDAYSADFESALEKSAEQEQQFFKSKESAFSVARSFFMSSQLTPSQSKGESLSANDNEESTTANEQGTTDVRRNETDLPSQAGSPERQNANHTEAPKTFNDPVRNVDVLKKEYVFRENSIAKTDNISAQNNDIENEDSIEDKNRSKKLDIISTGEGSASPGNSDNLNNVKSNDSKAKQFIIGSSLATGDGDINEDIANDENSESPSSIVRMRLRLFENSCKPGENAKALKTISNKKYALGHKPESTPTPSNIDVTKSVLDTNVDVTKSVLDKTTSEIDDRVDKLNDDRTELSKDKIDVLKEESECEIKEHIPDISVPVNDTESQTPGTVLVEHENDVGTEVETSISSLDQNKTDILKDISPACTNLESRDLESTTPIAEMIIPDKSKDETLYPEELNPFGDEDEFEMKKTTGKVTLNRSETKETQSLNPFGSSDEDDEIVVKKVSEKPPRPPVPVIRHRTLPNTQRVLEAPKVSLNPFWSDGEEQSSEEDTANSTSVKGERTPVPLPRTVIGVTPEPCPVPRKSLVPGDSDKFGSVSSLSSLNSSPSGTSSRKKKKPAPAPPRAQDLFPDLPSAQSPGSSRASSPCPSPRSSHSPRATPRHRKSRPAPLPPASSEETAALPFSEAKIIITQQEDAALSSQGTEWEREKNKKDVANRNRQSQSSCRNSVTEQQLGLGPNKSTYGQWKRKKGPAPPRPVPQRRQIKAIPMQEVRRELDDIEVQQQELERQGVTLEQTIRGKFDHIIDPNDDSNMPPEVEILVLQLFELVNEKNELFRRQAELMYLRRQHRLEEEHADLEYQIRCLMDMPEHRKTDSDKQREEELIQRLVEVVERRNEIVECLEMDRIREAEEDRSIHARLGMMSKGNVLCQEEVTKSHSGKQKKKKKDKEKNIYKRVMKGGLDVDKDIDEREEAIPKHIKEKKTKRKWF